MEEVSGGHAAHGHSRSALHSMKDQSASPLIAADKSRLRMSADKFTTVNVRGLKASALRVERTFCASHSDMSNIGRLGIDCGILL
jgi:hypothetical protein